MPVNSQSSFLRIGAVVSLPLAIYSAFFTVRILNLQPTAESCLGDYITSVNFLFGGSICYFVFLLGCLGLIRSSKARVAWWFCAACILVIMAFDEVYMIHEKIGGILGIPDYLILVGYGLVLIVLFLIGRSRLSRMSLLFLCGFGCLSGIALLSDAILTEGMITVLGRKVDYEQLVESFGALLLSCAFSAVAIRELGLAGEGQSASDE